MRRFSVLLGLAAFLLTAIVGVTYTLRALRHRHDHPAPTPQVQPRYEAVAQGWSYSKDDPNTNQPMVRVKAASFEATKDPSTFLLRDVKLRLFHKDGDKYTYVSSAQAFFDERSGLLKSDAPVRVIMNIPANKNAEDGSQVAQFVTVDATGVTYETKTGKAESDNAATFHFTSGGGHATGVVYDPNTGDLTLKSNVSLDMASKSPGHAPMHIEGGSLIYKEKDQKVLLSPWSKLVHGGTTVNAGDSVVTLADGVLRQVDSQKAAGSDVRDGKQTHYSADLMTALFNEDGAITNLTGVGQAVVTSESPTSRTTLKAQQAELSFSIVSTAPDAAAESDLDQVVATGHAVAQSDPLPKPGETAPTADSHTLRCERIILHMQPGGKEVAAIEAPSAAVLDFTPHLPDHPKRSLTTSHLNIFYGSSSYIQRFVASDAVTHTQKPATTVHGKIPPPSTTWSDTLTATFKPDSNEIANIEQTGHFRYAEGQRKAVADKAYLDQAANRITLLGGARVADDTGATIADKIVMDQSSGDMDATGKVISSRAPDKSQKPGTSVLDASKQLEARADRMSSREGSTYVTYSGNAKIWQGANRTQADTIVIDRENKTLTADGHVDSELVDTNVDKAGASPIFTSIEAPKLVYKDDERRADYTGGVKLVRNGMTVVSKQLTAYLNAQGQNEQSSLNHAVATGDVQVVESPRPGDVRTGSGQLCEFYTKENKVILTGGRPQVQDSIRGLAIGQRITYFGDDDKLIVEGENKKLAYSTLRKK